MASFVLSFIGIGGVAYRFLRLTRSGQRPSSKEIFIGLSGLILIITSCGFIFLGPQAFELQVEKRNWDKFFWGLIILGSVVPHLGLRLRRER